LIIILQTPSDLTYPSAFISKGKQQAELAGDIHEYATLGLIILSALHLLAALKHHFLDKDKTLIRILTTRGKI